MKQATKNMLFQINVLFFGINALLAVIASQTADSTALKIASFAAAANLVGAVLTLGTPSSEDE
jgi:hypothetical protein